MDYIKPRRLRPGDNVAVISTSWGGPHVFPHVFDLGLKVLRDRFGLVIKEYPSTRMSPKELAANPQLRAKDFSSAFADESVAALIVSIGGEDSARILRYLDADVIQRNPKVLIGFSDTTTQHLFCHNLGLVTFYGPSVMAGLSQLLRFPEAEAHIREILFEPAGTYLYKQFPQWTSGYPQWSEPNTAGQVDELRPHDGWHWLNGSRVNSGRLFGGCFEVLEFVKGTKHWPTEEFWSDRIFFLETSEDKPSTSQVRQWLFNYGVQGVFDKISGLLIGRAHGYTDDEKSELDEMIVQTVVNQFGASKLPIVSNMDFGHTDPQWLLPLGIEAEVNCVEQTFRLLEAAVI
ncbi:MAG: S66 peptidase family protein [Ilumatobacteraceae bacterium]